MEAPSTYQKLILAFQAINITFFIGVDPSNTEIFKPVLFLTDPWSYPRRIRGRIVSHPLCESISRVSIIGDFLEELKRGIPIVIYKWDRKDPEQVDELKYTWNDEDQRFRDPAIEPRDLGEHK